MSRLATHPALASVRRELDASLQPLMEVRPRQLPSSNRRHAHRAIPADCKSAPLRSTPTHMQTMVQELEGLLDEILEADRQARDRVGAAGPASSGCAGLGSRAFACVPLMPLLA